MTHAELIKDLGGGTALAAELARAIGLDGSRDELDRLRDMAYKWSRNGVPGEWRSTIARIAHEKGIHLPPDFDTPGYRPKRRRPRAKKRQQKAA